ncbi:MAG: hypothetical protein E7525_04270 [Ruminococcaceae bacterium]|nr:hypothetical protein [Oscillospiraceae bacterium]
MNKSVVNIFKWLGLIFAVFYLFTQLYSVFIDPVTTDTVYSYSTYSGYSGLGYIIRNETVVTNSISGSLSYAVPDGGRVAKGGTVAVVYSNSEDADRQLKIDRLGEQIKTLETVQSYNDVNAADVPTLSNKIHSALMSVVGSTQNGAVSSDCDFDALLELINRKQIITGEVSNFNSLIASLKAEKAALESAMSQGKGTIKSPESGYVVCTVDGYENVIKPEDIASLNAESLASVSPTVADTKAVCKIVSDYQWYIAVQMPFDESLNLKVGSKLTLMTELVSVPELSVTVQSVNKESVGENAVVVFSCDTMNTELAALRFLDLTVVYSQHQGLKVDNRAIRKVNGVTGVYVLLASQVHFVPINVLWSGENFSIVEKQASDDNVLRLYDEIIVKGKNLHDGKIIK